jgi:hypothetical protein
MASGVSGGGKAGPVMGGDGRRREAGWKWEKRLQGRSAGDESTPVRPGRQAASEGVMVMVQPGLSFCNCRIR